MDGAGADSHDHTPYLIRAMTVNLPPKPRRWEVHMVLRTGTRIPGAGAHVDPDPASQLVQSSPSICRAVTTPYVRVVLDTPRILCSSSRIQVGPRPEDATRLFHFRKYAKAPLSPSTTTLGLHGARQQRVDNQRSCCIKRAYPTAGGVA
jgi:hypothetical protein